MIKKPKKDIFVKYYTQVGTDGIEYEVYEVIKAINTLKVKPGEKMAKKYLQEFIESGYNVTVTR